MKVIPKYPTESNIMKIVFSRKELSQKLKFKPQHVKRTTIKPDIESLKGILLDRTPFKRKVDERHFDVTEMPDAEYEVTGVLISLPFGDVTTATNSNALSSTEKSTLTEATTEDPHIDEQVISSYYGPTTEAVNEDNAPLPKAGSEMTQNTETEKNAATTSATTTSAVPEPPVESATALSRVNDAQMPPSVSDVTVSPVPLESTTQTAALTMDSALGAAVDTTQASNSVTDDPQNVGSIMVTTEIASYDQKTSSPSSVTAVEMAQTTPIAPEATLEEKESVSPFGATTEDGSNDLSGTEGSVITTATVAPTETTQTTPIAQALPEATPAPEEDSNVLSATEGPVATTATSSRATTQDQTAESSSSAMAAFEAAQTTPITQLFPEATPVPASRFDATTEDGSNDLRATEGSVVTSAASSEATTENQNGQPTTSTEMAQITDNDQNVAATSLDQVKSSPSTAAAMAQTTPIAQPLTETESTALPDPTAVGSANTVSDVAASPAPVDSTAVDSNVAATENTSAGQVTSPSIGLVVSTENGFDDPSIDPENVGVALIDTTTKPSPATHTTPQPKKRHTMASTTTSALLTATNPSAGVTTARNAFNFFEPGRVFNLNPILSKAASHASPVVSKPLQSQTNTEAPSNMPFLQRFFKPVVKHPITKTLFPPRPVKERSNGNQNMLSTIWKFNGPLFEPKKVHKRQAEADLFVTRSPRRLIGSTNRKSIIERLHEETSIEKAERRHKAVERLMHVATIAGHFDQFLTGRLKHGVKALHKILNTDEDTRTRL